MAEKKDSMGRFNMSEERVPEMEDKPLEISRLNPESGKSQKMKAY